jgi:hypothetical protein
MHKGEIVEEGNHDSLMGALSTYFNLVQQQSLHKTEEEEEVQKQENNDILLSNRKYEHRLSCERARSSTVVSSALSEFPLIYDKHVNPDDNNDDELKKEEKVSREYLFFLSNRNLIVIDNYAKCSIVHNENEQT